MSENILHLLLDKLPTSTVRILVPMTDVMLADAVDQIQGVYSQRISTLVTIYKHNGDKIHQMTVRDSHTSKQ